MMQARELDSVPAKVWSCLRNRSEWHKPVLASALPGGGADARTVVLRHVLPDEREVIFFSDRRLAKVPQLHADPQVCLVIYDPNEALQIRLYGTVHQEKSHARLDEWWAELPDHQRRIYQIDCDEASTPNERGRENFAAFRVKVGRFHCLWLRDTGNEAAEFQWDGGSWHGQPVHP